MRHAPEAVTRKFRQMENPEVVTEKHEYLVRNDRHNRDDDQRDCRKPGEQASDSKHAAHNIDNADERVDQVGKDPPKAVRSARLPPALGRFRRVPDS